MAEMQKIAVLAVLLAPHPETGALVGEVEVEGLVTRVCSLRLDNIDLEALKEAHTPNASGVAVRVEASGRIRSRIRLAFVRDEQEHEIGGWNHLCHWWHDGEPCEVFYIVDYPTPESAATA